MRVIKFGVTASPLRISAHLNSPNPPNPGISFVPFVPHFDFQFQKVFNRCSAPTRHPSIIKPGYTLHRVRGYNNISSRKLYSPLDARNSSSNQSPVPKAAAPKCAAPGAGWDSPFLPRLWDIVSAHRHSPLGLQRLVNASATEAAKKTIFENGNRRSSSTV